jgi:hypothetical protein
MRRAALFVGSDDHVSVNGHRAATDFALRDTPQSDGSIVKGDKAAGQDVRHRLERPGAGAHPEQRNWPSGIAPDDRARNKLRLTDQPPGA